MAEFVGQNKKTEDQDEDDDSEHVVGVVYKCASVQVRKLLAYLLTCTPAHLYSIISLRLYPNSPNYSSLIFN